MESTLVPGDKVLVEKLTYGPRTPVSPFEVPWVNLLFYINKKARAGIDSVWWQPGRLTGAGALSNGDVIVLRRPEKKDVYFIKRCVGIAGDTLAIINGKVLINNSEIEFKKGLIRNTYRATSKNPYDMLRTIENIGIVPMPTENINDTTVLMDLDTSELEKIEKHFPGIKLEQHSLFAGETPFCFPKNPDYNWNIDHFGPVLIPGKGITIEINRYNYNLYRKVLNHYEKRKIHLRDSVFYDGDSLISNYTFQRDYCFVLGDNRKHSQDSRYMGFIPFDGVEGKAILILWTNENGSFRHSRFFKRIH